MLQIHAPADEAELLLRCRKIEGLSLAALANQLSVMIPADALQRKGWVGGLLERALGTTAGSSSAPDFCALGIELKTIPINASGRPAESTFVTSIPLLTFHQQTWLVSSCYLKLKRVLWVPFESAASIPFAYRRFGRAILWSPTATQMSTLEQDWVLFSDLITTGKIDEIDARMGEYLQVRPKGADGKSLCLGVDEQGEIIKMLPRGFYLRSRFTAEVVSGV